VTHGLLASAISKLNGKIQEMAYTENFHGSKQSLFRGERAGTPSP